MSRQATAEVIVTRVFVSKGVCPTCGKVFYGDDNTEVLSTLGGHMSASHNGGKKNER